MNMLPSLPLRGFDFLRHGQTDWNVRRWLQGWTDIPLNSTGLSQRERAAVLAEGRGIVAVISSPLQRAAQTGAYVAEHLGVPLELDERLKERGFGSFEGRTTTEICAGLGLPEGASLIEHLPEDAEPNEDIRQRVQAAVREGVQRYPQGRVMFSSHGSVFRTVDLLLCGNDMRLARNGGVYAFEPCEGRWTMAEVTR